MSGNKTQHDAIAAFKRGATEALSDFRIADEATCDEAYVCGGPDFMSGEATDEPPEYHAGRDWVIRMAREKNLLGTLITISQTWDARHELSLGPDDCAARMADHARAAIKKTVSRS